MRPFVGVVQIAARCPRAAAQRRDLLPEGEVMERRGGRGGAPGLRSYLLLTPSLLLRLQVLTNIGRQLSSNSDSCLVLAECYTCKLVV